MSITEVLEMERIHLEFNFLIITDDDICPSQSPILTSQYLWLADNLKIVCVCEREREGTDGCVRCVPAICWNGWVWVNEKADEFMCEVGTRGKLKMSGHSLSVSFLWHRIMQLSVGVCHAAAFSLSTICWLWIVLLSWMLIYLSRRTQSMWRVSTDFLPGTNKVSICLNRVQGALTRSFSSRPSSGSVWHTHSSKRLNSDLGTSAPHQHY